ncbi:hypothetical protein CGI42_22295 [Vibrio parahaemolyticus]|uniref:Uncharacterized protein n=1 Tax=Vibrio vulnificus TaxID=672 RepID=A0AAN1UFR1_VIBVL|nr:MULTISPECIES: hypothetical protein [Vibrio]AXX63851.1 hypothetical protein FORC53_5512 [Vibrio vulnificus]TOJ43365.1 hypothetical protein CGI42_22295 [Vibrio parahaemolyticus]
MNPNNKTESSTQLEFVDPTGWALSVFWFLELEDDEEVIAFSSDDRVVNLIGAMRVSSPSLAGCGSSLGGVLWEFEEVKPKHDGLYDLVCALPEAIKQEKARRIANKIAWKRWEKNAISLGYELTSEPDYADVILEKGLNQFLQELR